eukprot:403350827
MQESINKIDFQFVFVSPMIRACQTTVNMFATHPNRHKIKFIIAPIIKEGLNVSNDLTHSLEYLYSLFGYDQKVKNHGISFDFSMAMGGIYGDDKIWNVLVLSNLDTIQSIMSQIDEKSMVHQQINEQIISYMDKPDIRRLESHKEMYERAQIFKKFLCQYLSQHRKLDSHEKIGIVSHASFLRALSGSGFDEETGCIKDGHEFKNCDIKPCFEKFLKFIKSFISQHADPLIGANSIEFIVRDKANLKDFLIDYDDLEQEMKNFKEDKVQDKSEEYFDKLDFIIIDSDYTSFCPWHTDYDQVRLLIKNCLKANKCLLGSHVVFNTIVYLKSMGSNNYRYLQQIKVINNNQKGDPSLNHIKIKNAGSLLENSQTLSKGDNFSKSSQQFNPFDIGLQTQFSKQKQSQEVNFMKVILQSSTGDMFQFDGSLQRLELLGNTGLTHKNNEQKQSTLKLGSTTNTNISRILNDANDCNNLYIFKCGYGGVSDILSGLKDKFMLSQKYIPDYSWITPKNVSELSQLQIRTILQSSQGQILAIEHGNLLGLQFMPMCEYSKDKQLAILLKNYITQKICLMQERGQIHIKLRDTTLTLGNNDQNSMFTNFLKQNQNKQSQIDPLINKNSTQKFSGVNINNNLSNQDNIHEYSQNRILSVQYETGSSNFKIRRSRISFMGTQKLQNLKQSLNESSQAQDQFGVFDNKIQINPNSQALNTINTDYRTQKHIRIKSSYQGNRTQQNLNMNSQSISYGNNFPINNQETAIIRDIKTSYNPQRKSRERYQQSNMLNMTNENQQQQQIQFETLNLLHHNKNKSVGMNLTQTQSNFHEINGFSSGHKLTQSSSILAASHEKPWGFMNYNKNNMESKFQKKRKFKTTQNQWFSNTQGSIVMLSPEKIKHHVVEKTQLINFKIAERENKEEVEIGEFNINMPKRLLSLQKKVNKVKIIYKPPKKIT